MGLTALLALAPLKTTRCVCFIAEAQTSTVTIEDCGDGSPCIS